MAPTVFARAAASLLLAGVPAVGEPAVAAEAASADPAGIEFFEARIRPLLAEHCYECHSDRKSPPKGRLRLDTPEHILEGGRTDVAVVPGSVERSLLARAVSYRDLDLKMPPDGRLPDEAIADLERWIEMGAPLPAGPAAAAAADADPGIDLEAGREFWAFRPVADPPLPAVEDARWPRTSIDHFVLAALEANDLVPAPPADRRSWLRRVTFDLTGLPPRPEEIEAFLADDSPRAHEAVVERLLASPHYGERWARHWLDLVRFAETGGHEFDNDKLDAWRYRDYVIRAFNRDVPYDRFVREHVAGDLLADQRLSPDGAHWESPIGTGFLWFGEVLNSPTDSVKSRADEVDNQLDVLTKAFQGMTVACARCHDHKFDPIPTADYYAMAGILHSTAISEAVIDSPERAAAIAARHHEVAASSAGIEAMLPRAREEQLARLEGELQAALAAGLPPEEEGEEGEEEAGGDAADPPELERAAPDEPPEITAWRETLGLARSRPGHVLHPLAAVLERRSGPDPPELAEALAEVREALREHDAQLSRADGLAAARGDQTFDDFERLDYGDWIAAGRAFGARPARALPPNQPARDHRGSGVASSFGRGSDALVGSLTSRPFVMEKPWVHVRLAGSEETRHAEQAELRVSIVAAGYKATHFIPTGTGAFEWQSRQTEELLAGRSCVIEIVDRSRQGHIAVDAIVFSDSAEPPPLASRPSPRVRRMLERPGLDSLPALVGAYRDLFAEVLAADPLDRETRWLTRELIPFAAEEDALVLFPGDDAGRLAELRERRARASSALPESAFALVAREGDPRDVRLHIGGSHRNLGEPIRRGFLQVVAGERQPPVGRGSGRRALADRLASPDNPLTARVMVNRIWRHHFGRGLVESVDNFGALGRRPTHPELLDHLATAFVRGGWSVKDMHRLILLSSAYRMSSRPRPGQLERDPENRWLHHVPVRRLEAEAIRDSILAVAGTLDTRLYGPGVTPHVSPFQDGRGKPESGPLDGDRRRSIYIEVRRNFLTPLLLAFDYPLPISTIGRRGSSTVPSQALSLLNNAFVAEQAQAWGRRVAARGGAPGERVRSMFLSAFGRPPDADESEATLGFVRAQERRYGAAPGSGDHRAWADLGHVLLNSTEFIFVR